MRCSVTAGQYKNPFSFSVIFFSSFILSFFMSADTLQFFGMRIGYFILPLVVFLIGGFYFALNGVALFLLLVLSASAAMPFLFFGVDFRGFGYILYLFANLFLCCLFSYFYFMDDRQTIRGIIYAFRCISFIVVFQYFILDADRPSAFFYESSYMAFCYVLYSAIIFSSLYSKERFWPGSTIDVFVILIVLFFTKSLFVFFGLSFVFFVSFFIRFGLSFIITSFLILFSMACVFLSFSLKIDGLLFSRIHEILVSGDPINTLYLLAGNRVPRIELSIDVLTNNYFFGVSPGGYIDYVNGNLNLYDEYKSLPDWRSPYGLPEINGFIGFWLNFGLVSLISLLFILFYLVAFLFNNIKYDARCLPLLASLIGFVLLIQIETSLLRPYFWIILGLALGQGYKLDKLRMRDLNA